MPLARAFSVALVGVRGHLIEVEADIANGLPATILVGLPDTALREARDRIRAAIVNTGESWPNSKITVGLSPAALPKRGSGFDLAIAVAILAADDSLPLTAPAGKMFLAELGLDGRLRPVPGVLPAVVAAEPGSDTVVVAAQNAAEAALVPGVRVVGASTLAEVIMWLRGGPPPTPPTPQAPPDVPVPALAMAKKLDLSEVLGQAEARMAVEICAAGGHHLSLLGPPGAGKTMLAERLPTILPRLEGTAAIEVTSIHSVAEALKPGEGLVTVPPFCAPHHTSSKAAIVGGGSGLIRPGAASLAHRGILFLDEAPEFSRDVLDALRQPLESGEVAIARATAHGAVPGPVHAGARGQPVPVRTHRGAGRVRVPLLAGGPPQVPGTAVGPAHGPGGREDRPAAGQPARHALRPQVRRVLGRGGGAGRGGPRAVRRPAGGDAVAAERRGSRRAAAPRVSPAGGIDEAARTGDGARAGLRPWRRQDHPGRLVAGRPGRPGPARRRRGRPRDRTVAGGGAVTASPAGALTEESYARAALTYLAEPADEWLNGLISAHGAARTLDAIRSGRLPDPSGDFAMPRFKRQTLQRSMERRRVRLDELPTPEEVIAFRTSGHQAHLPGRSGVAGAAGRPRPRPALRAVAARHRRPALQLPALRRRGRGSRAATAYGSYVAAELASSVAARGWAVVSGGAFGVDASAHRARSARTG